MARPARIDEVTKGAFIAWRLFLRDRKAVALIDNSADTALRSFLCALVILPLVFVLLALQLATETRAPGNFGVLVDRAGPGRTLSVLAVFYVIRWTAWPVIMYWLAGFLNAGHHYFRYLAAYNWSQIVVMALQLLYAVIHASGIASGQVMAVVSLLILTVMWTYHWFILRNVLDVNGGFAAILVAAHFLVSALIEKVSTATVA